MGRAFAIAAPKSGSGKTTLTLGLMRAFKRRGLDVAGLKNGPDYIDPQFHAAATGGPSFNLDSFCMDAGLIRGLVPHADLTIFEGSMGLFDGVPAPFGQSGASGDIAALLGLPVLLVVDVSGQAQSAAALVRGFCTHRPDVRIGGVILNKVASPRHRLLTASAIEELGVPVLGVLPPTPSLTLPERHLGLVQAGETDQLNARLEALADFAEAHCNLDAILALAADVEAGGKAIALKPPAQRIALASDAAFSFIYPHLLAGFRQQGAEILPFSPLNDEAPPDEADFCWLPGGYPELHAGHLADNARFLNGLRQFATTKPVYGECGGYMVLGEALIDAQGVAHAMAGLLGHTTSFAKRKMTLGYRRLTLAGQHPLGREGTTFNGHEFHYSTLASAGDDAPLGTITDAYDDTPKPTGARRGWVSGSYIHIVAESLNRP